MTPKTVLLAVLALVLASDLFGEDVERKQRSELVGEGLLLSKDVRAVYASDVASDLNRIFNLLFVAELIPAEVQAALASERAKSSVSDTDFYRDGWYFLKRKGDVHDQQIFGGDIRVSPRRSFDEAEARELKLLLDDLGSTDVIGRYPELSKPMAKLLLQWDILSVWWALERNGDHDETLLTSMANAIVALAQPEHKLRSIDGGLMPILDLASEVPDRTSVPYFPNDFNLDSVGSEWIEVGRKSSTLFRADRSLRVSRVFLKSGDAPAGLSSLSLISKYKQIASGEQKVPDGTASILIQQMIGIDDQLKPVATNVIDEVRVRLIVGEAKLSHDNLTSSRDGSSHWIYMRNRAGTLDPDLPDFHFVPDTEEALFIEYGTLKHANFAAQCALCHRRTAVGASNPSGIRVLEKHAAPVIVDAGYRASLAESEMTVVVEKLKSRLSGQSSDHDAKESPAQDSRLRGVDRAAWARKMREAYSFSSAQWPAPTIDSGVQWTELGNLPRVIHPDDNPYSKAKAELGRLLFFDPRLSGSQQIACASCHDPDLGWADGRAVSFGHSRKSLSRNAPTVMNSGFQSVLFWDGRASSLEDQAIKVLTNPDEMRATEPDLVEFLTGNVEYRKRFAESFGEAEITMSRVAEAIACFERTLVGGQSRFDRFIRGRLHELSDEELIGLDLFRRDGRCMNCHHGPTFSDGKLHNIGLSNFGRPFEDLGRYEVTKVPEHSGQFKTPSLRNVTRTTPLMHNGLFELSTALNLYNIGMPTQRVKASLALSAHVPVKSELLKPLKLTKQDLGAIEMFLKTLEEPWRRIKAPTLPE